MVDLVVGIPIDSCHWDARGKSILEALLEELGEPLDHRHMERMVELAKGFGLEAFQGSDPVGGESEPSPIYIGLRVGEVSSHEGTASHHTITELREAEAKLRTHLQKAKLSGYPVFTLLLGVT